MPFAYCSSCKPQNNSVREILFLSYGCRTEAERVASVYSFIVDDLVESRNEILARVSQALKPVPAHQTTFIFIKRVVFSFSIVSEGQITKENHAWFLDSIFSLSIHILNSKKLGLKKLKWLQNIVLLISCKPRTRIKSLDA